MSKIYFIDCLSVMHWNWREQSQSFFENLKHNKINSVIIQLVGVKYVLCVCLGYVYEYSESLIAFFVRMLLTHCFKGNILLC
jgi:hypothetical protein